MVAVATDRNVFLCVMSNVTCVLTQLIFDGEVNLISHGHMIDSNLAVISTISRLLSHLNFISGSDLGQFSQPLSIQAAGNLKGTQDWKCLHHSSFGRASKSSGLIRATTIDRLPSFDAESQKLLNHKIGLGNEINSNLNIRPLIRHWVEMVQM